MPAINASKTTYTTRITVTITDEQKEAIAQISRGRGLSEAGAIRTGIVLLGMADTGVLYTRSEAGEYEPVTIFVKSEEAF